MLKVQMVLREVGSFLFAEDVLDVLGSDWSLSEIERLLEKLYHADRAERITIPHTIYLTSPLFMYRINGRMSAREDDHKTDHAS